MDEGKTSLILSYRDADEEKSNPILSNEDMRGGKHEISDLKCSGSTEYAVAGKRSKHYGYSHLALQGESGDP